MFGTPLGYPVLMRMVPASPAPDARCARLEWEALEQQPNRVGLTAPPWVLEQLDPHFERRSASRLELDGWNAAWELPGEIDTDLRQLLDLLEGVCSIGFDLTPVEVSLALDMYKIPDDEVDSADWNATEIGELVNRSKYRNDGTAFKELTSRLNTAFCAHPDFRNVDAVISIPGRIANRYGHGEKLAYRIAKINNIPFVRTAPEYETRGGAKEGYELSPNDISLQLEYDQTAVAVIDDVMMSGGSMRTVGQLAFDSGADRVVGLVAAKTLRNRAS